MIVTIPFKPEFETALKTGVKTATSRTSAKGKPGDTFSAFGKEFVIISVEKKPLFVIRDYFWEEEGCASPADFERVWKVIHPRRGFRKNDMVFLHRFVLKDSI